ncbi:SDR family NAD(P)-dependent oxidoreductase [Nocardia sp. CDC159]|uniref:SDR family NAD(P)-dependent oxidoreductase n=1 Tax=Nocardia pulmonis TaxID=2951408 RepID=A0A9X2J0C4_9NOCA|nr:SDR family NAD(P)-dependent oxidoreductase [Nocardia pulmonis]MCM6791922.1 SDR family NAD(P)-dependent oxidoreductase [Nocardia sp. CDC159]
MIKVLMAMRHGVLPKTLHVDDPTTKVDWSAAGVRLLTEARPWPETGRPRRAAVSAFGVSGTNAHVIVEQAPELDAAPRPADPAPAPVTDAPAVWVLSAKSAAALVDQARRLRDHVLAHPELDPVDIGYSLLTTRARLEHRAVIIGSDRGELLAGLDTVIESGANVGSERVAVGRTTRAGRVGFVFPGQGGQWAEMARELLDSAPAFAARIGECAQALEPHIDWSLSDVLTGAPGAPSLDRVDVVQPVLFSVMVSLAALWESFGVRPDGVIGHSQGEVAAACVAGVLSLADAARIVAVRSKLVQQRVIQAGGDGGMASIAEPVERVEQRLAQWPNRLWVAAVNGPAAVTIAGDVEALTVVLDRCAAEGVWARRVPVDYASHSPQVEPVREPLLAELATVTPAESTVRFHSTVLNAVAEPSQLDAEYWFRNLREPVRFDAGVRDMVERGYRALIEVSPHPVLAVALGQSIEATGHDVDDVAVVGTLRHDDGGPDRVLLSLAEAYVSGVPVDWSVLYSGRVPRRIDLPTYAFQRERFWIDTADGVSAAGNTERALWASVERGDLDEFATLLAADDERQRESLGVALNLLSNWRAGQDTARPNAWRYRVEWIPGGFDSAPVGGHWLVVLPRGTAAAEPARTCLRALGEKGAHPTVLELDTAHPDRTALTEVLATADGILSLLALDDRPHPEYAALPSGLAATMVLAQALSDTGNTAPLWLITRGAVRATPADAPAAPAQAAVWGFGRVLGLELPTAFGGLLDLPDEIDESISGAVVSALGNTAGEDQIAIRPNGTYVRRLTRDRTRGPGAAGWRPRGAALVTGGTGALGGHVARWLADQGADHLILISRHGRTAPGAAKLADELAACGTTVTIESRDITSAAAMTELFDRQRAAGHPIRTVVHCAGVSQPRALGQMTTASLAEDMAAKARGAVELARCLDPEQLDAFVLFSSGAGVWGSAMLAGYAAANAYLDAFAEELRERGLPATAVAWGAWSGDGMGADEVGRELRRRGIIGMAPERAVRELHRVLGNAETTSVLADIDWERFLPVFAAQRTSRFLDAMAREVAAEPVEEDAPARLDGLAELPGRERLKVLRKTVLQQAAAALGYGDPDALAPKATFQELGFDSIAVVQTVRRLAAATGLRLATTVIFDHPTPERLARHLDAEIAAQATTSGPAAVGIDAVTDWFRGLDPADAEYAEALDRMRRLLAEAVAPVAESTPGNGTATDVNDLTDDELFEFVDTEFGLS